MWDFDLSLLKDIDMIAWATGSLCAKVVLTPRLGTHWGSHSMAHLPFFSNKKQVLFLKIYIGELCYRYSDSVLVCKGTLHKFTWGKTRDQKEKRGKTRKKKIYLNLNARANCSLVTRLCAYMNVERPHSRRCYVCGLLILAILNLIALSLQEGPQCILLITPLLPL